MRHVPRPHRQIMNEILSQIASAGTVEDVTDLFAARCAEEQFVTFLRMLDEPGMLIDDGGVAVTKRDFYLDNNPTDARSLR